MDPNQQNSPQNDKQTPDAPLTPQIPPSKQTLPPPPPTLEQPTQPSSNISQRGAGSMPLPPSAPEAVQHATLDQTRSTSHPKLNLKKGRSKISLFINGMYAISFILMLIFILNKGVNNSSTESNLQVYSNEKFNFSILAPESWQSEVTDLKETKRVVFSEPLADLSSDSKSANYSANIAVNYDEISEDALQFSETEYFDLTKEFIKNFVAPKEDEITISPDNNEVSRSYELENEERLEINGLKAYKIKVKITYSDNDVKEVAYMFGLFVYGDAKHQYSIYVDAHESEPIIEQADKILGSFEVLK